jgi:hypothetical protein
LDSIRIKEEHSVCTIMTDLSPETMVPSENSAYRAKIFARLEEWWREYLTQVREHAKQVGPVPLPSKYEDDELVFFSKRMAKWLQTATTPQLMSSLYSSKKNGKVIVQYKLHGDIKDDAITVSFRVSRACWDAFWEQRQERIDRDAFFQITDSDRIIAAATAARLDMGGQPIPSSMIWDVYQLSPTMCDNAFVYLACSLNKPTLFDTLDLASLNREQVPGLCAKWCYQLAKACPTKKETPVPEWLMSRSDITEAQKAKVQKKHAAVASGTDSTTESLAKMQAMRAMLAVLEDHS